MVISMTAHISDDGLGREESVAEHTEKTTFLCAQKGKRCGLSKVMSLCGLFHDLGKNKQKFHDYLHEDESTRQKLRGSIAHASTGAKYIYDRYHGEEGCKKYMAEMISYAIAAHHGLFDCVGEVFNLKRIL
ncbi:CRISPR-associated endonuclease Cas3'' [Parablautia intestinalis]|jgi:CRISPR-associated endonuclease/helicase Cas3|uniref:CRISPR-associated endonuclease Cas3 n=1 Tax=Parablautia intestinalis TaxID=2320100 RepID=A0A3A9B1T2_9FIRM|nr:CRISPR-associated endonuclease Cas3'' [Parablautia intestinalis]MCI8615449.1 CRISPR-associated endonuclease Cas3'' [Lachnospiraceae bacterium]MDE7048681.1 CRISPR-associated endonuclease Cas3'' [Lachnospiraceae bacterium]RKI93733.1 CRISPR-associated endonuclease Cas3'' [Parablautia intestinalis]